MSNTMYLDIETTGFSRQWDYIIEIAAEIVNEKDEIVSQFHKYIKPGKTIPLKIVELTGITNAQVSSCDSECNVLRDFHEWVFANQVTTIIGHNCKAFDLGFIADRCAKYHINWNTDNIEIIDTLALARQLSKVGKISVANCKQPTLAEYFDIEYDAHSAIEDIHALQCIYKKMKKLNKPATRNSLGF